MAISRTCFLWICLAMLASAQAPADVVPSPSLETLLALQQRIEDLGPRLTRVTVGLRVGSAGGSGVLVSEDGLILTAAHVFTRAGQRVRVTLHDGQVVRARTLGRMERDDYGMLRIESDAGKKWPFAELGVSEDLERGQLCLATGHPGGVDRARGTPLRLGRMTRTEGQFLRSTCIVDSGDSGGPLFDLSGRVIGIHSRIGRQTGDNFHIAVDRYRDAWDRLLAGESWGAGESAPIIGINGVTHEDGLRITRVYEDLPAATAGVKVGDVLVLFDGQKVTHLADLRRLIGRREVGDTVRLVILRGEQTLEMDLSLGKAR